MLIFEEYQEIAFLMFEFLLKKLTNLTGFWLFYLSACYFPKEEMLLSVLPAPL